MSLLLPFITFILISLALFSVFVYAIKRFPTKAIVIVWLAILAESIGFAIYTLITFHGAFGPGIFLFFVSPIVTIVILIGLLIAGGRLLPELDKQRRTFYLIGAIFIISAQLSPIVGINGIGSYCDRQTRKIGDKIVTAIQSYKNATGVYPTRIEDLAQDYWKGETSYNCLKGLGVNADDITVQFRIQKCRDHPSLVTDSTDGVNVVWYDFETNQWSSISFLDSSCY